VSVFVPHAYVVFNSGCAQCFHFLPGLFPMSGVFCVEFLAAIRVLTRGGGAATVLLFCRALGFWLCFLGKGLFPSLMMPPLHRASQWARTGFLELFLVANSSLSLRKTLSPVLESLTPPPPPSFFVFRALLPLVRYVDSVDVVLTGSDFTLSSSVQ